MEKQCGHCRQTKPLLPHLYIPCCGLVWLLNCIIQLLFSNLFFYPISHKKEHNISDLIESGIIKFMNELIVIRLSKCLSKVVECLL